MSTQTIALEMQNVSKRFGQSEFKWLKRGKEKLGTLAVDHVSVTVYRGEIPVGLWLFRAAEKYAKRSGKLKRNG